MTGLPLNTVVLGDCLEVLRGFPDASVDAVVTDPPAGISFMGREWDADKGGRTAWVGWMTEVMQECLRVLKPGGHALVWSLPRTSHWTGAAIEDAGFEVRDCIHHLKDRSLEVRAFLDSLTPEQQELLLRAEPTDSALLHCFGSGFPKSLNVSRAIEAQKITGRSDSTATSVGARDREGLHWAEFPKSKRATQKLAPLTDNEAQAWEGWHTALKPAVETWWLCRKPIEAQNVASQVLATGTGAINVDGTRVGNETRTYKGSGPQPHKLMNHGPGDTGLGLMDGRGKDMEFTVTGRWPSNLVLSHSPECRRVGTKTVENPGGASSGSTALGQGSGWNSHNNRVTEIDRTPDEVPVYECAEGCPVAAMDRQTGTLASHGGGTSLGLGYQGGEATRLIPKGDSGGASRFFNTFEPDYIEPFLYTGKASKADKNADLGEEGLINKHPTVKSQALCKHLVRLVTPKGGIVLDPFAGSGSTLVAAITEGMNFIGIEREPEYHEIAKARTETALGRTQEQTRQREAFAFMDELPQE